MGLRDRVAIIRVFLYTPVTLQLLVPWMLRMFSMIMDEKYDCNAATIYGNADTIPVKNKTGTVAITGTVGTRHSN